MGKMPKRLATLALVVALIGASKAGASEQYFIFTFSGSGVDGRGEPVLESGSAFLGGISIGNSVFLVNHVAGTANGQALRLLPTATLIPHACPPPYVCYSDTSFSASDAPGDFVFDNAINMSGTGLYLDVSGFGFETSSGDNINIFGISTASQYVYFDDLLTATNPSNAPSVQVNVNISALTPLAAITSLSGSLVNLGFGAKAVDDLGSANSAYADRDFQSACEAMTDFIAAVQAQAQTRPAKTLAVALIGQARIIMSSIGCFRS